MKKLLLVDDDVAFLEAFTQHLADLEVGIDLYPPKSKCYPYDGIIVSLDYSRGNALEILRSLRKAHACCSILTYSSHITGINSVLAHDAGADDHFAKQTDPMVIEAKLRRAFRHREQCRKANSCGGFSKLAERLDSELTRFEQRLLRLLSGRNGELVSRDALTQHLWGSARVESKLLYEHISTLRNKLRNSHWTIVNVRGRGYRLESLTPRGEEPPSSRSGTWRTLVS